MKPVELLLLSLSLFNHLRHMAYGSRFPDVPYFFYCITKQAESFLLFYSSERPYSLLAKTESLSGTPDVVTTATFHTVLHGAVWVEEGWMGNMPKML